VSGNFNKAGLQGYMNKVSVTRIFIFKTYFIPLMLKKATGSTIRSLLLYLVIISKLNFRAVIFAEYYEYSQRSVAPLTV